MLAKLIAVAIREVQAELAKLDAPQAAAQDPEPAPPSPPESLQPDESRHRYDPASTVSASTERAASWDHDKRQPVTAARFGFGPVPAGAYVQEPDGLAAKVRPSR